MYMTVNNFKINYLNTVLQCEVEMIFKGNHTRKKKHHQRCFPHLTFFFSGSEREKGVYCRITHTSAFDAMGKLNPVMSLVTELDRDLWSLSFNTALRHYPVLTISGFSNSS